MADGRFLLYWSSATASYLGDGVRFSALPLLAASLTSSPAGVASIAVAAGLPWLLFGLVAGVVVDRLDRTGLMSVMQLVRALVGAVVVAAVVTGSLTIPTLAALVFLLCSCEVLYDIAFNSALPAIVDRSRLQWANGRLITAEVVAFEFAGPALGGLLFALNSAAPFAFDAATFVVSSVLLLIVARRVRGGGERPARSSPGSTIAADLAQGIRWFRGSSLVRSLTVQAVATNLGAGGVFAVLVLFVREELSIGPVGYGLLLAVSAAGSVSAGLLSSRLAAGTHRKWVVVVAAPAAALSFGAVAAAPHLAVVIGAMVLFGAIVTLLNVVAVSLRQLLTPDEMLGRVMAVHRFFCWGAIPVGAALGGLVGELFGVRAAIAACAAAVGVISLATNRPLLRADESDFDPQGATP